MTQMLEQSCMIRDHIVDGVLNVEREHAWIQGFPFQPQIRKAEQWQQHLANGGAIECIQAWAGKDEDDLRNDEPGCPDKQTLLFDGAKHVSTTRGSNRIVVQEISQENVRIKKQALHTSVA